MYNPNLIKYTTPIINEKMQWDCQKQIATILMELRDLQVGNPFKHRNEYSVEDINYNEKKRDQAYSTRLTFVLALMGRFGIDFALKTSQVSGNSPIWVDIHLPIKDTTVGYPRVSFPYHLFYEFEEGDNKLLEIFFRENALFYAPEETHYTSEHLAWFEQRLLDRIEYLNIEGILNKIEKRMMDSEDFEPTKEALRDVSLMDSQGYEYRTAEGFIEHHIHEAIRSAMEEGVLDAEFWETGVQEHLAESVLDRIVHYLEAHCDTEI